MRMVITSSPKVQIFLTPSRDPRKEIRAAARRVREILGDSPQHSLDVSVGEKDGYRSVRLHRGDGEMVEVILASTFPKKFRDAEVLSLENLIERGRDVALVGDDSGIYGLI
jgi:ribonuclease HII